MKLGVVGLGYSGLCTAVCLARKSEVIGIDVDDRRVSQLNHGEVPFHEKSLPALLKKGIARNALSFTRDYTALLGAEIVFVAVGTPSKPDGSIDLSQVTEASSLIGKQLAMSKNEPLVVIKSTVTPGTATSIIKPLLERVSRKTCGNGFGLCSNPEFLREGEAIQDTLYPDRIVIGPTDKSSSLRIRSFYRRFYGPNMPPIVECTPETAELIKYASNTFLATKISFINFIARICETLPGADVQEVARAMGLDPRIGEEYLQAGPGFGGACFPKDSRALVAYAESLAIDGSLIHSVLTINDTQPGWILATLERRLGSISGREVCVLGAAFKEESDDVRESRAIVLARALLKKGARVRICDPMAIDGARKALGGRVSYFTKARDGLKGAEAAVVMTAWNDFKRLRPADFVGLMRTPILVDARRIYDPLEYQAALDYTALGRGTTG